MAELLEIEENDNAEEAQDLPTLAKETQQPAPEKAEEQTLQAEEHNVDNSDSTDELPEKYRGKTVKELVEMHQNAEKALGKQGGEVGELRKIVDEYIQSQPQSQPKKQEEKPIDEIDFYTNPDKAVESKIENHPAVKEAREAAQAMKVERAQAQLLAKHPDIRETLTDPKFAEWVQKSPYRKKQFIAAEVHYDLEAVDELMTSWKEHKSIISNTAATEKGARKEAVREASTGSTQSSQGGNRKPIYRRADIIKLMTEDPDRYEALYPEIAEAYADKRVR